MHWLSYILNSIHPDGSQGLPRCILTLQLFFPLLSILIFLLHFERLLLNLPTLGLKDIQSRKMDPFLSNRTIHS